MLVTRRLLFLGLMVMVGLSLVTLPVDAGDRLLTNNASTDSAVWFISGEPSLVMNGFDLTRFGLQTPASIDRVSIDVETPIPGAPIQLLVYQDANGGSPVDATLVSQTTVDIRQSGVFVAQFNPPLVITQPVVWVGFYLPVDFKFRSDKSGTSVLTYWAWSSGTRFDVNNLSSAQVLGPSDGSAPVSINMNGVARITAEVVTNTNSPGTGIVGVPVLQTVGTDTPDFGLMQTYDGCPGLRWDIADVQVSLRETIDLFCRQLWAGYAPPAPNGYFSRPLLYDIVIFNDRGVVPIDLTVRVTHCIEPAAEDLNNAVIGFADGSPRQWKVLPTVRYASFICAEVPGGGLMTYFVPSVVPTPTPAPPAATATPTA